MKKLKEPKAFKYPRMYYQPGTDLRSGMFLIDGPRIRIIYPDGKTEWMPIDCGGSNYTFDFHELKGYHFGTEKPCWSVGKHPARTRIIQMNEWDKVEGKPKAVFLGEIK